MARLRSRSGSPRRTQEPSRLTLVGMTGCEHTYQLRQQLARHGLRYAELDLLRHHSKAKTVLSGEPGGTVPQLYYGSKRLPFSVVAQLFQADDAFLRSLQQQPYDQRPLLHWIVTPHRTVSNPATHSLVAPNAELAYLYRRLLDRTVGLSRRTIGSYYLWSVYDSFRATELVMWIMKESFCTEAAACRAASSLCVAGYIVAASGARLQLVENAHDLLLKLRMDVDPAVLNAAYTPDGRAASEAAAHPLAVAEAMRAQLRLVTEHYVLARRGSHAGMDYERLPESPDWRAFTDLAVQLQAVPLNSLVGDAAKKAFFLNVYECLLAHALVSAQGADSEARRAYILAHFAYDVGGHRFTAADILHGVLRCNARPPGFSLKRFGASDPRMQCMPTALDPRIHFAGMRARHGLASPAVPYFSPDDLDEQLDTCTHVLLDAEVDVDLLARKLRLPAGLQWYASDISSSRRRLAKWLRKHMTCETKKALLATLLEKAADDFSLSYSDVASDLDLDAASYREKMASRTEALALESKVEDEAKSLESKSDEAKKSAKSGGGSSKKRSEDHGTLKKERRDSLKKKGGGGSGGGGSGGGDPTSSTTVGSFLSPSTRFLSAGDPKEEEEDEEDPRTTEEEGGAPVVESSKSFMEAILADPPSSTYPSAVADDMMNLEIPDPECHLVLRPGWSIKRCFVPQSEEGILPRVTLAPLYAREFHRRPHDHYVLGDRADPYLVSVRKLEGKNKRRLEVLLRSSAGQVGLVAQVGSPRDLWELLGSLYPRLRRSPPLEIATSEKLEAELVAFEQNSVAQLTAYKCGVLYVADGQRDEDEIFSNRSHSREFEDFLGIIGSRVKLQGFEGYAAGLDTVKNGTGEESVHCAFSYGDADLEIMYHVSTLLPFNPKDPQQIDRKRHLGNDSVVLVFLDGSASFDPRLVTSQYCQVFILVCYLYDEILNEFVYRVDITSREEVPPFVRDCPSPPRFSSPLDLAVFLRRTVVDGVQASLRAPQFLAKIGRSTKLLLQGIIDKHSPSS